MIAGRELDALVAEKVMGIDVVWVEGRLPLDWSPLAGDTLADLDTKEPHIDYRALVDAEDSIPVPDYSTDIAAAWEVVAKMQAKGWDWEVSAEGDQRGCLFLPSDPDDPVRPWANVTANTTPLAICLAALSAVGA